MTLWLRGEPDELGLKKFGFTGSSFGRSHESTIKSRGGGRVYGKNKEERRKI